MLSVRINLRLMAFVFLLYLLMTPWVFAGQMRARVIADGEVNKAIKFL